MGMSEDSNNFTSPEVQRRKGEEERNEDRKERREGLAFVLRTHITIILKY